MPRLRHALILLLVSAAARGDGDGGSTPTATPTSPPPTLTATAAPTATATLPPTASRTSTPTLTLTATLAPSATPTASPTATPSVGAIALFSIDALDPANPFPTDRLLDDTGHVHVNGAYLSAGVPADPRYDALRTYLDATAATANLLEGFGTFAPIRVKFDAPVRLDVGADPPGVLLLSAEPPFASQPVQAAALAADVAGEPVIEIQPIRPLAERARYVYVVTTEVHDADGNRVRSDPDLHAALRGDVPELAEWRTTLTPLLDHLRNDLDITLDEIAAIEVFTTQPITDDLTSIVELFTSGTLPAAQPKFSGSPIPDLITGIFPEGSPEFTRWVGAATSETIGAVAVGSFASYDFRYGRQRGFDPDKVSGAVTPSTNELDFYMTIPKGPPPAGGHPITVYQHGLVQSADTVFGIAPSLGPEGGVLIAISALEHGRRGNYLQFFNFTDGLATREHFRQTVADIIQLVRMIRAALVPPFDQIDKDRIRYIGISLGGVMGAIFMAYEPDVDVGMLSVPGGGLPAIIRSPVIGTLLQPLIAQTSGVPQDDPFFPILLHNFINISQWLIDAGDPINVAPFVIDPERHLPGVSAKRILMHEGIGDTIVPNVTTENLALAMGLPDVRATGGCVNEAGCNGIWRFAPADYGFPTLNGHLVTLALPQAMAQAQRYLESDGTEIIDAAP